ncbi:unnamed protein product [Amoebophrya sp. A120]|nr:unnamed protein product [Amoebophrya sp. A120]|eukprot:GSA120T00002613001.1
MKNLLRKEQQKRRSTSGPGGAESGGQQALFLDDSSTTSAASVAEFSTFEHEHDGEVVQLQASTKEGQEVVNNTTGRFIYLQEQDQETAAAQVTRKQEINEQRLLRNTVVEEFCGHFCDYPKLEQIYGQNFEFDAKYADTLTLVDAFDQFVKDFFGGGSSRGGVSGKEEVAAAQRRRGDSAQQQVVLQRTEEPGTSSTSTGEEVEHVEKKHSKTEKSPLPYSLAYGSLLGYERHKSFIPYDSDADIMLPLDFWEQIITFVVRKFVAEENEKELLVVSPPSSSKNKPRRRTTTAPTAVAASSLTEAQEVKQMAERSPETMGGERTKITAAPPSSYLQLLGSSKIVDAGKEMLAEVGRVLHSVKDHVLS